MAQFSSDDPNTALEAELIRQQQIIADLQQQMEAILVTQRPVIPSTSCVMFQKSLCLINFTEKGPSLMPFQDNWHCDSQTIRSTTLRP